MSSIDDLIEQVREAVASPRNQERGKTRPAVVVGIEDPIAWTILYGFDANRYFSDPLFYFEQVLRQKLWRWETIADDTPITLDVPAWMGHYPEYTCLGMSLSHNARGVPILQTDHPLTREPDLGLLQPVDFYTSGWMPRALRWYDDLRRIADGRLPVGLMTWNRGCLDLAIQLRGYETFLLDTMERPRFVYDLMRFLVEQRNRWYTARAGFLGEPLGATWVADDWINIPFISPGIFRDFVLPYYLEIERHHGAIGGVHSCGDQTPVQRYLLEIKSLGGLEVSPWTDLAASLANVPPEKHLHIGLHPNDVLVATPADMRARLERIRDSCRGRSYSVGTSGLTPIYDDNREFSRRIDTWLAIAWEVFGK